MSVIKPTAKTDGIKVKVRNCAECDFHDEVNDTCKKRGHTRPNCADGVKTIMPKK